MKTVDVALGARSYQVRIGRDLLSATDEIAPWIAARQVCIVTDDIVAPLYLARLRDALAGKEMIECVLAHGEARKNLAAIERVIESLLRSRFDRDATIVALGGGVVGDIAGFAAACYQRGIAFIQAPTTLLAQVDSSVGGKTGVNHALGKNMIGAFHQPRRVLADTAALDTLAPREFSAGLAEVIKYGI
ncbi:MAG: 3-dehydroquinate synthase family protein, partial [bacterium]